MDNGYIDFRTRRQTIANDTFAAGRPFSDDNREFFVVIVQAAQSDHVTVKFWWSVGHQMAGAIANGQLPIFPTLHGTCTVAVVPMNVKVVFIGKSTTTLFNANRTGLWIVLDIFQRDHAAARRELMLLKGQKATLSQDETCTCTKCRVQLLENQTLMLPNLEHLLPLAYKSKNQIN